MGFSHLHISVGSKLGLDIVFHNENGREWAGAKLVAGGSRGICSYIYIVHDNKKKK